MTPLISRLSVFTPTEKPGAQERSDRVLGDAADGADLDVARRRQLEVDLAVEDVAGQRSEAQPTRRVGVGRRVAGQAHAVADAVGAVDEGVVDQLEVGWLAGVDRHVQVVVAGEGERVGVQRRRVAGLGTGQVEGDDLGVDVAHPLDQLGRSPASGRPCAWRSR